jgi:hypothetical protein
MRDELGQAGEGNALGCATPSRSNRVISRNYLRASILLCQLDLERPRMGRSTERLPGTNIGRKSAPVASRALSSDLLQHS